jgi:anti-sigma-K factor RskA
MNIANNPELLDKLAVAYALGTLRGGARRRFEAIARESVTVRVAALMWHERLSGMNELQLSEAPSTNVWKRIVNALAAERDAVLTSAKLASASSVGDSLRRALNWWRTATAGVAVASMAMLLVNMHLNRQSSEINNTQIAQLVKELGQVSAQNEKLKAAPVIEYVAVLADDKSTASVLVTFDPSKQKLTLKRVGNYQESADKSLQLWALPAGGAPQSLAVLGSDAVARYALADSQMRAVPTVPTLAISLEPKGGVPSAGGPTGPVLFKGALLQTAM